MRYMTSLYQSSYFRFTTVRFAGLIKHGLSG